MMHYCVSYVFRKMYNNTIFSFKVFVNVLCQVLNYQEVKIHEGTRAVRSYYFFLKAKNFPIGVVCVHLTVEFAVQRSLDLLE